MRRMYFEAQHTDQSLEGKPSMSRLSTPRKLKLGLASAGMLITPAEFDAVTDYDERYRYELIKRVLVVTRLPSGAESDPNDELGAMLRNYQAGHPMGATLDLTHPERYVHVPDGRRRADRVIWVGLGRLPDIAQDVPSIVVEFVSKARRDRERDYEAKRRQYLDLGVTEYWVIDRFRRTMNLFRREPPVTGIDAVATITETQTYQTDLLPGFELPLARLLAVADRWR
jgi:Uma2 family endonuclease